LSVPEKLLSPLPKKASGIYKYGSIILGVTMDRRILVVDDSIAARNVVKRALEICGIESDAVTEAVNGRDALDKLKEDSCFSLVITDLNMPGMDGEQLLKRIKASPKLNEIPVIVISSMANPSKESKLLRENASKILSKPISLPDLQEFIELTLNNDEGVVL
jgi:two-component system chemotaxis response regulator CheY